MGKVLWKCFLTKVTHSTFKLNTFKRQNCFHSSIRPVIDLNTVLILLRHLFLWAIYCYNKKHLITLGQNQKMILNWKRRQPDCLARDRVPEPEDSAADWLCGDELMRNRCAWLLRQSSCVHADKTRVRNALSRGTEFGLLWSTFGEFFEILKTHVMPV